MKLDEEAFRRGLWPEALVAALASLAVAWPLTGLLREDTWLLPGVLLVALVAIVGAVLRTLDVPPSFVSLGQLLLAIGGVAQLYLKDTLWRGLVPTRATLDGVTELLQEAGTVLQTYAAPAPTTDGVSFLVVAVLTLTAVSVDSMGVTGRAPASAGIPLAAGFLVSVSNSGQAMEPWYFAAVAACWLLMMAQQGHRVLGAWPSADRREAVGDDNITQNVPNHRGLAQTLGVLSLVVAVLGASAIPHLPPTFFADGLARDPDARTVSGDAGQVSFTETMDPGQDLRNQSQAPVLSYRTDATRVEPLRVTATERWEDGRWVAPTRTTAALLPVNAPIPTPEGLSGSVEVGEAQIQVLGNALEPPHLAAPGPLSGLTLEGGDYRFDPTDATVVLQSSAERYSSTYLTLPAGGALPAGTGDAAADTGAFDEDLLAVDPASADAVAELAQEVVGDVENDLAAAVLMQNHFRSGQYRYSLTLAPAAESDASDPIGGFLETGQGYCVQFATAMVMMARGEGIPARMAVGFLPGTTQVDGTRKVIAADAHTWPELWISGLGWTRFEPTPGIQSGPPPAYARNPVETGDAAPSTQTVTQTVTPSATPEPDAGSRDGLLDQLRDILPILGRVLVGALVLALLMALIPLAGRRYREEGVRSAEDARERVEGQWLLLTRTLGDLGVDEPPARSPRDMGRHYRAGTALHHSGEQALGRVTATLERARYAAPGAVADADAERMGEDVREVVDQVRHTTPWNVRANAALLPRSGMDGVRDQVGRLFRR
ncbi:transglutaminaseTgpA domain-containing protein [Ornithinimicrobium sp. LYQ121]|uniref:transglutaminase family protein n=1 Tax=Ornithinimicrobium sp. LYQ121 TaxID=3378801 RepID=UPI003853082D